MLKNYRRLPRSRRVDQGVIAGGHVNGVRLHTPGRSDPLAGMSFGYQVWAMRYAL